MSVFIAMEGGDEKQVPRVRQLDDGTYLCDADGTVFSNARFAERHARMIATHDESGVMRVGSNESAPLEEEKKENAELGLYAQAR